MWKMCGFVLRTGWSESRLQKEIIIQFLAKFTIVVFCVGEFINDLVEAKNCILSHSFKPWRDSVNIFLHPSSPQMFFAILEVSYCNPFWAPDWQVIRNDYHLFTWFYIYSYSIAMLPHIYFFLIDFLFKSYPEVIPKNCSDSLMH